MLWNHWELQEEFRSLNSRIWYCAVIQLQKDAATVIMPPSKGPLILRKTMGLWMVTRPMELFPNTQGLWPCLLGWEEIWSPLFTFLTLSIYNRRNPNYFQNCISKGLWETFLASPSKIRKSSKEGESICNTQYALVL